MNRSCTVKKDSSVCGDKHPWDVGCFSLTPKPLPEKHQPTETITTLIMVSIAKWA